MQSLGGTCTANSHEMNIFIWPAKAYTSGREKAESTNTNYNAIRDDMQ